MSAIQSLTAVMTDIRKIEMRQFAVPEPAKNDAVLKVELCGICGSDYHYYVHGEHWPYRKPPQILGHEVVGRISASAPRPRRAGESKRAIWSLSRRRSPASAAATAPPETRLYAPTSAATA